MATPNNTTTADNVRTLDAHTKLVSYHTHRASSRDGVQDFYLNGDVEVVDGVPRMHDLVAEIVAWAFEVKPDTADHAVINARVTLIDDIVDGAREAILAALQPAAAA